MAKKNSGGGLFGCLWTCIKWTFAIVFFPVTLLCYLFNFKRQNAIDDQKEDRDDFQTLANNTTIDEHFVLQEQIQLAYSQARKSGDYFSPEMNYVITLCERDIALAGVCRYLWLKYDKHLASLPNYDSFKRLAIIYEKRGDYKHAAAICEQAISMGFTDDGTQGGMQARVRKLLMKI